MKTKKNLLTGCILFAAGIANAQWAETAGNAISTFHYLGSNGGSSSPLIFKLGNGSGNYEAMRILGGTFSSTTTGGFVGIGNITPSRTLHVQTTQFNGGMRISQGNTGGGYSALELFHSVANSGHNFALVSTSSANSPTPAGAFGIVDYTATGAPFRMFILPTGWTGMGTLAPQEKLHIHDGALRLTGTSSQGGPMVTFGGTPTTGSYGEWSIEYTTSGTAGLNFWKPFGSTGTAGNNYLFLNNSGRVGINTNNCTAQLTVNGNVLIGDPATVTIPNTNYKLFVETGILTEKVRVAVKNTGNWMDFVFDRNYKLSKLSEVEAYVSQYKHLPGIPSAEEVVKDGIDLGEMNSKLLGKIEELTLYMIEQDKRATEQDKKIEELERALKALQEK